MSHAYIIDACRTPRGIGKIGRGKLAHLHPQHLAATVLRALAERNSLDTSTVDDIIWGTSTQVGKQGAQHGSGLHGCETGGPASGRQREARRGGRRFARCLRGGGFLDDGSYRRCHSIHPVA